MTARSPRIVRRRYRLRRLLVVTQVALSLVLLVGGFLFGRSLFNLLAIDTGFAQTGILELDADLTRMISTRTGDGHSSTDCRGHPADAGVAGAAAASTVPFVGNW